MKRIHLIRVGLRARLTLAERVVLFTWAAGAVVTAAAAAALSLVPGSVARTGAVALLVAAGLLLAAPVGRQLRVRVLRRRRRAVRHVARVLAERRPTVTAGRPNRP